jgi:hypothetical protein
MEEPIPEHFTIALCEGEHLERTDVWAIPYWFVLSTKARWEMVISDEDIRLKKGEVAIISVKEVKIPKNHIIIPHGRTFNPMGCVLKVAHEGLYLVECERVIDSVIFFALQDYHVRKGDLLDVLQVYPISIRR